MKKMDKELFLQKIREDYTEKEHGKMDELKALDKKVKFPAQVLAYTVGTVGSLVFGTGMCLAMGVIGKRKVPGVIIGCAGMAALAGNYYLYENVLKSRKEEYADQILQLSEEILAEEEEIQE